jgi:nucleotide-binding universal stress UspA family protein
MMTQTDHVLCAVDFSEPSRHALDYAVALSRWHRATVTALYVHRLAIPVMSIGPYTAGQAMQPMFLTAGERAHLSGALDRFVASDREAGTEVRTQLDEDFDVAGAIVSRARELSATTIVVGTHGRTGVPRWLVGSIAERVVRTADGPVVTVPPRAPEAVPASERGVHRILCPVDFSDASRRALDRAATLAVASHAQLTVAHVVDLLPDVPDMPMPDATALHARRLEEGRQQLADTVAAVADRCAAGARLLQGSPYRQIVQLASGLPADLIVMGVHGRGALDLAVLGSTTQQVIRHAPCAVMTLRS